jgi:hypothetical protein
MSRSLLGIGDTPSQSAKANRQRLAPKGRAEILEEIDKKAVDVRINIARLRELRRAKEAQEVRTAGTEPAKPKPRESG